jgi:hypothetical protein
MVRGEFGPLKKGVSNKQNVIGKKRAELQAKLKAVKLCK